MSDKKCKRCHEEIEAVEAIKTERKSRLMEEHKRLLAEKQAFLDGAEVTTDPLAYDPADVAFKSPSAPIALGVKLDGDKPRWDLLLQGMPLALEEVVRVLTYGSEKYADHNWKLVDHADQRYLAASMRHEMALQSGETHDSETDLHHLAHKLCCDLFRLELALRAPVPPGSGD